MDSIEIAKEAKRFYVAMQINEMLPLQEYEIYVKEEFNTASWRFYDNKHQIIIGADIFNNIEITTTFSQKLKYIRSFLYHELAHSIWTEKDIKWIASLLKEDGYSFQIFNLFEDARIEENMRKHTKMAFNWSNYEEMNTPQTPISMLFFIIQSEHKYKYLNQIRKNLTLPQAKIFTIVFTYYKKIVSSKSSLEIIPILKQWYLDFPDTIKDKGLEDIHLYTYESFSFVDDTLFENLLEGSTNILISKSAKKTPHNIRVAKANTRGSKSGNTKLLSDTKTDVPFDTKQRDILLKKMQKLFITSGKNISTRIPSKKLHIKNLLTRTDKIYKRKSLPKISKKKITIILDMSGSMCTTIDNMRLLIDVLDRLARKNFIDATLILSASLNSKSIHQVLPMPLAQGTIERLNPDFSGEGLKNTMNKNINLLTRSDYVWIFTDGWINDTLNKRDFHKYNIKTHAMYIGNSSSKKDMLKSFDYVICEESVADLSAVISELIK